ncbi:MAG: 16S rRNA (cytosine(1402)-N(4))-methyltransferase RsmH [Myxococcales bacterium]|nr:16S rRNA (cytosine(1402)-N(4))-methyltransferase RsmH [Myxococcales bacterium]
MSDATHTFAHATVLLEETIGLIAPRAGGRYADVTLGGGGHAEAILERSGPDGVLLGIDRDTRALDAARARLARFGARATLVQAEAGSLPQVVAELGFGALDGVVADLGVSSPQLDDATRGFSFRAAGPLDMRMDPSRGETAKELAERLSETELADVIYQLGDERKSRPIARAIKRAIEAEQLETTDDLRAAVHRVIRPRHHQRIDPATRTFQALRIAVNDELGQLDRLLAALPDVLAEGGVAAIISFHSLEDRRVKNAFREDPRLERLTKKPIVAGDEEATANPRARSAKLRGARRRPEAEVRS